METDRQAIIDRLDARFFALVEKIRSQVGALQSMAAVADDNMGSYLASKDWNEMTTVALALQGAQHAATTGHELFCELHGIAQAMKDVHLTQRPDEMDIEKGRMEAENEAGRELPDTTKLGPPFVELKGGYAGVKDADDLMDKTP